MLGKHTVNPGEKAELKVIFHTTGHPGPFQKNIVITTDVAGQEEIELSMTGTVKEAPGAKIQVNPRKADFGAVKAGSAAKLHYTVTNTGTIPLLINKIHSPESGQVYFDGSATKEIAVDPGKSKAITIEINPRQPGSFMERIVIVSNAKNAPKGGYIIMATGRVE